MEHSAKLYTLSLSDARTWLVAAIFAVGNLALPALVHQIPQGGLILLPIYFFTLVGAYKYGLGVGVLTAVLSPLAGFAMLGMPSAAMLTPILVKGVTLAFAAAWAAKLSGRVSLTAILCAVVAYQMVGIAAGWLLSGSLATPLHELGMGVPGMVLQVLGGWAVLKALQKL